MAANDQHQHLLRRAGLGASAAEMSTLGALSLFAVIDYLVDYDKIPDDVDDFLGQPGYLLTTSQGPFRPNTVIADARQRWLFRMVHSARPLQERGQRSGWALRKRSKAPPGSRKSDPRKQWERRRV